MQEYEKLYFEHKKRNIINLLKQFNERYGSNTFSFELEENSFNLEELCCKPNLCCDCGQCCSTSPCIFSPYDFLNIGDIDYMKEILNTGLICISVVPNSRDTLMLRPRGEIDNKTIYSNINKINPCILKNNNGCMLAPYYRPTQGLLYIPRDDKGCILHSIIYPDYKCEGDYQKFQKELNTLLNIFYNLSLPTFENITETQVNLLTRSLIKYPKK